MTNETPATQANLDAFAAFLESEYERQFTSNPEYAYSASKIAPAALARRMTLGLDNGTASKEGAAVREACKHFKIGHTYVAIRKFLQEA